MNKINPDDVADAALADVWWQVLAPWKSDGTGRMYTYLVPPGIELAPGQWFLVEDPKGGVKTLKATEVREHFPTAFLCKPIGNVLSADELAAAEADPVEGEEDGTEAAIKLALVAKGLHADYQAWKIEAQKMHAEGR